VADVSQHLGKIGTITVDAIISTAFGIVEKEGYEALTMWRVVTALETGPLSGASARRPPPRRLIR
jgi:hypothetical protein